MIKTEIVSKALCFYNTVFQSDNGQSPIKRLIVIMLLMSHQRSSVVH